MDWTPLYIIPGLTFLFWALVHACLTRRTSWHSILMLVLLSVFFTAAGDVIVGAALHSETAAHMVIQLMAPTIIPLVCLYFAHLYKDIKFRFFQMMCIILPVMLFTASAILVGIIGLEETDALMERMHKGITGDDLFLNNAERAYYMWTVTVFRFVMGIEAIIMLLYCIVLTVKLRFSPLHVFGFLFRNRRIRVLEVQVSVSVLILLLLCLKIILHQPYAALQSNWSMALLVPTLAALQFIFGFFALFGSRELISMQDIRTALRFNYGKENASATAEEIITDTMELLSGDSLTHVLSRLEMKNTEPGSPGTVTLNMPSLAAAIYGIQAPVNSLPARFLRLMQEEQLYLQPGLTLTEVARRLNTNKTYVSKMVNENYHLGFPEVLNILRIDYAEAYIRKHPDAPQEDIARACGFVSASSFNSTFKRITGYTPRVWAARTGQ